MTDNLMCEKKNPLLTADHTHLMRMAFLLLATMLVTGCASPAKTQLAGTSEISSSSAVTTHPAGFDGAEATTCPLPDLISALKSDDSNTRYDAAQELGKIGGKEAAEALVEAFKEGDSQMHDVIVMTGESAVEPLIASTKGEMIGYVTAVIDLLSDIGGKSAIEALARYLHDPDLGYVAATALGKTRDNTAVKYLSQCLNASNIVLNQSAIEALALIATPDAENALIAALKDDTLKSETLRDVVGALGTFHDPASLDALVSALTGEIKYRSQVEFQGSLETALVSMGSFAVEPLISKQKALKSTGKGKYDTNRYQLILVLGRIKDKRAVSPLIAIMQDKKDDCRDDAANALGSVGDSQATGPLIAVVDEAIGIIHTSPSPNDKDHNFQLLHDSAMSLGKIGDNQAVSEILSLLADKSDEVRSEIASVIVLGKLNDPRYISNLDEALDKRDLAVINGAISYYIKLGRKGSEKVLISAFLKYGYSGVAISFYFSGNETLKKAAKDWAAKNGYIIIGYGNPSDVWGSGYPYGS